MKRNGNFTICEDPLIPSESNTKQQSTISTHKIATNEATSSNLITNLHYQSNWLIFTCATPYAILTESVSYTHLDVYKRQP